ncbi:hypothetical protein OX284_005235 [Flavobacterium sp. SUN046]|uniref:hypothetical protein n=1 Tax=Flavobacterium sp. SUN046 TaxID=3002440 RepID=UPI002DB9703A|nr:hypothetical protein [Flavobacterium sp. SUN046]MEC4048822.1 hypothetical protein [Flavobacterium sp. SUN046]
MNRIAELGDIVIIRRNKHIWADENGLYIITKLNDLKMPVEVQALTKTKMHYIGEVIANNDLLNYIYPIKLKASDLINHETFIWIKELDVIEPSTIVHFIGNNRYLEFILINNKLVSNLEFEFYTKKRAIVKGRIGFELPMNKPNFKSKYFELLISFFKKQQ